jgi:tetratricopeptide (TPR) repeat protein
MSRTATAAAIVVIALAAVITLSGEQTSPSLQDAHSRLEPLLEATFDAAYNLDHADAARLARSAVALAPQDPRSHRALATVLWLELLFRQGALTLDFQLAGLARSQGARAAAPAALDSEIKQELARAAALSDASVRLAPASIDARYEYGAVNALEASYAATVVGSTTTAFGAARRAFDAHERVLERNPSHGSATVTVGSYRYLISGLAMPGRIVAYMAGFGGGKEKGIAMLEAARRDPIARTDAETVLLLIYSREGRHAEALAAARELAREFPRNRLFSLEVGSAALRAGRLQDADASLTRGLTTFAADPRAKMPGELALLRYKRGLARLQTNRTDEAVQDFRAALDSEPANWLEGRVRLELGVLAVTRSATVEAAAEYRKAQQACLQAEDRWCAADAGRRLKALRNPVE